MDEKENVVSSTPYVKATGDNSAISFRKFTPQMLANIIDDIRNTHDQVKQMHNDIVKIPDVLRKLVKTPKRAIITIISASIITIGIMLILIALFLQVYIGNGNITELRMIVTRYGLIESKANYMLVLTKVKEIDRLIQQTMKICNKTRNKRGHMTESEREDYASCVYAGRVWYDIDENLLLAITSAESDWNKIAKSNRDAKGLWQLLEMTFEWINQTKLDKFGTYDIYNVFHNSEAAIRYIAYLKSTLSFRLGRKPLLIEIAYAYHAGLDGAMPAINTGEYKRYLSKETLEYGDKVMFYVANYRNGKYGAWWYEKVFSK